MKKISPAKVLRSVTNAAAKKGVTLRPGSEADKTTAAVVTTGVKIANEGISLAQRISRKGSSLLEKARERVHEATKPAPPAKKKR
jgi:heterodisulfide reductase subunit C